MLCKKKNCDMSNKNSFFLEKVVASSQKYKLTFWKKYLLLISSAKIQVLSRFTEHKNWLPMALVCGSSSHSRILIGSSTFPRQFTIGFVSPSSLFFIVVGLLSVFVATCHFLPSHNMSFYPLFLLLFHTCNL